MPVAVVTGASSGIGQAAARKLAADGYSVLAVGRDQGALDKVCREIDKAGGRAQAFVADVTTPDGPAAIVRQATSALGGVDALVNAAGIIASAGVAETTDQAWDTMMDINVRAPFRLIREAASSLIERKGSVVNVSSVAGPRAFPGVAAYCVSKAAVDQLTRVAALDFAPKGVRVNAVNPGRRQDQPPSAKRRWKRRATASSSSDRRRRTRSGAWGRRKRSRTSSRS